MFIRAALALCLIMAGACATTIDTTINDAVLTAAVKTALLNERDVDGTLVTVQCESGAVRLGGTQPTRDAAAKVVEMVRRIQGVRDVQSSIVVGPAVLDRASDADQTSRSAETSPP